MKEYISHFSRAEDLSSETFTHDFERNSDSHNPREQV